MDMHMDHALHDSELDAVSGGVSEGTESPLYEVGSGVYVSVGSGKSFGRVTERRYDETQGWLYTVQTGFLTSPTNFVPQGAAREYPESSVSATR